MDVDFAQGLGLRVPALLEELAAELVALQPMRKPG